MRTLTLCVALALLALPAWAQDATGTTAADPADSSIQPPAPELQRPEPASATTLAPAPRAEDSAVLGVLGDDIGFTLDGHAKVGFIFIENFDLWPEGTGRGPNTINSVNSEVQLEPKLYISEIAQIAATFDLLPDVYWGGDAQWTPVFQEGYVQFITVPGKFRLGRQWREFGAGLAYHRGDEDHSAFGFVPDPETEDRLEWDIRTRFGSVPLHLNLGMGWIDDPYANGIFSKSDRIRYALQVGTHARDAFAIEGLLLFDNQNSYQLQRFDASIYTRWLMSRYVVGELEGGLRRGSSTGMYTLYDPLSRTTSTPEIEEHGYRGLLRVKLQHTRTKKGVYFDNTALSVVAANGPRRADQFRSNRLNQAGTAPASCGCLIGGRYVLPQMRASYTARQASDLAPARAEARDSAALAWSRTGDIDGLYIPSFLGSLGYKDFVTQLGFYFLGSVEPMDTRILKSNNGTVGASFDDYYQVGRTLGYELDLSFRYTMLRHLEFGLDTGLFFGGSIPALAPAQNKPAYMLLPRLTVTF